MKQDFAAAYLDEARRSLRGHKRLAEGALAQLSDAELFQQLDSDANSIAVLIKHVSGNMRSRFTDFLTSDGEKSNRDRDQEFIIQPTTPRQDLMRWWEEGWGVVFATMVSLHSEDFDKKVLIRGQEHSVLRALNRAVAHYAYHVGQIVLLAKHIRGEQWRSLSIPRGQSSAVNERAFTQSGEKRAP
jgi:hypothetical protein